MTSLKRLVSRLLAVTEAREPRPAARDLPPPSADAWQRLHDALWRQDYGAAIRLMETHHVVVFLREDGLVIQTPGGPMPERVKHVLVARQQPLLSALQRYAQVRAPGTGRSRLFESWDLNGNAMRLLLRNGGDPNGADGLGRTPLHEAVARRRLDLVEALLEGGAQVAVMDHSGRTPLHMAAEEGDGAIVAALVAQHHAAVNVPDASGRTALHLAAALGRSEATKALLAANAEVDTQNREQRTPLWLAVDRGDAATVEALLLAGADPEARDVPPRPLAVALDNGRTAVASVLLTHGARVADLEARLMQVSLDSGDLALLQKTLDVGVDPAWEHGRFLCQAVERDMADAVDVLLRAGAPAACQDNRPLRMAVYAGRHDIAARLKQADAPVAPRIQEYEVTLNERLYRFQLDVVSEVIEKSEMQVDGEWRVLEDEASVEA